MLDKAFVESFLRVNNTSTDVSDDEIKSVLYNAKWSSGEIESALALLRGKVGENNVIAVSKGEGSLFRPDFDYSSDKLSVLLGVDVVIEPEALYHPSAPLNVKIWLHIRRFFSGLLIVVLSIAIAVTVGFLIAYVMQAGPFYSPIESSLF